MNTIKGARFLPIKTNGYTMHRSSTNIEWHIRNANSTLPSTDPPINEYGAGNLVADSNGDSFILIYEVDGATGVGQQCALYPDGTKLCPAPSWNPILDKDLEKKQFVKCATKDGVGYLEGDKLIYTLTYLYDGTPISYETPITTYWYNTTTLSLLPVAPLLSDIKDCSIDTSSDPALHLEEKVGNITHLNPFGLATCVRISYLECPPNVINPIKVTVLGLPVSGGNNTYNVYPNMMESFCFGKAVITGVTISGAATNTVDIEYRRN